jgi:two-component system, OmpR family, sensor histidine kinase CreC
VRIQTRIILSFSLLVGLGFYFLIDWMIDDLRPRYLEAVEEALIDESYTLAELIAVQSKDKPINPVFFHDAFQNLKTRKLEAKIYDFVKTDIDHRVYITDAEGIILFDSEFPQDIGLDYSKWRNIKLTKIKKYGARTTRAEPNDPKSSVLHISAPILYNDKLIGILTVAKPTATINEFIQSAQPQIKIAGIIAALSVILLGILLSKWVTSPIKKLREYAQAVRDQKAATLPELTSPEVADLGKALEEMRMALEGKKYVEKYLQTFTHEIKSPLAAIQGASELLQEDMPKEKQDVFLQNIHTETLRIKDLVNRMLDLAAIENKKGLENVEDIKPEEIARRVIQSLKSVAEKKQIRIELDVKSNEEIRGEEFLIEQALQNLVKNAIEFSPANSTIQIEIYEQDSKLLFKIADEGAGIPDYAQDKIFDRFYSLKRPDSGRKSSGLGLSFVKEVAELHYGDVIVQDTSTQGTVMVLSVPI